MSELRCLELFVEQKVHKTAPDKIPHGYINVNDNERPQLINDVKITQRGAYRYQIDGIQQGSRRWVGACSLVLIGGEPGIGKSTLVL